MDGARPYVALFQLARLDDETLGYLLDCLMFIDCAQLAKFQRIPLIYNSGVGYYHDGKDDPWMDVLSILSEHRSALARGTRAVVDCEDLACWRAAELRVRFGVMATPCWVRRIREDGKQLVHIFVKLPDGTYEDPSKILGMNVSGL